MMSKFKRFLTAALLAAIVVATASAEAVVPRKPCDWQRAKIVQKGIRSLHFTMTSPRPVEIEVLRVDLTTPGLTFFTCDADPDAGKPMPDYPKKKIQTKRETTRSFARRSAKTHSELIIAVAVNASAWGPWTKPFNHKYATGLGPMVNAGKLIFPATSKRCAFAVDKLGKPEIRFVEPNDDLSKYQLVLKGFHMLMLDGKDLAPKTNVDPRMVYGISTDRRHLYLMAVDGRQKGRSMGLTLGECTKWMKYLGCSDAINMDGGGSATMLVRHRSDFKRLNNLKSGKYERPVANSMVIGIKK